jgi:uncharacterized protein YecE (DUF72 family)
VSAAAPAIHVGTSGYSFPDWVGPFYPPGTKSGDFLAHYARHFGCVEVNSTWYRIPKPDVLERMQRKTPEGFRFVVKVNRAMTHDAEPPEATWGELTRAIQPLKDAGKYHGLLAQFPWAFRRDDAAKARLERLRERLGDEPLWVEFRHDSWMHPRLADWLRVRRIGYCAVDEPALRGLLPPVTHLTTDTGYVRLHGRNTKTWWAREGGGDRYDYEYSEAELMQWVERVRVLAGQAKQTYLFFNNCHAGQAARNAKLMEELLRRSGLPA